MKKIKLKHIGNLLGVILLLVILFNPDVKAWFNQQFMKLGFHKPDLEMKDNNAVAAQEINEEAQNVNETIENAVSVPKKPSVWFMDSFGKELDAANQHGKVVFINFWATWCPPCLAEMPSIDKLHERFKDRDDIVFFMVDVDGKLIESGEFMVRKKLNLPVHIAKDRIPEYWLGSSIPTTVILDKKGEMVVRHEGMADYSSSDVFDFIQELLDENAS